MENIDREKRRATNMIWNAALDYSFQPEFQAYDRDGGAELYWNYIMGAVRRDYDYPKLEQLLKSFEGTKDQILYENLLWLGLENCTYERERAERPALEGLRRRLAEKFLREATYSERLPDNLQTAHFQRVLGLVPQLSAREEELLNTLEFGASLSTQEIVDRTLRVLRDYLYFTPRSGDSGPFVRKPVRMKFPLFQRYSFAPPQKTEDGAGRMQKNRLARYLKMFAQQRENSLRAQMERSFGASIYKKEQTSDMERLLCSGSHKDCHLHITRGEYPSEIERSGPAEYQRAYALRQREKNRLYYNNHLAQHRNDILRLTERIRSALLNVLPTTSVRFNSGVLEAGRVWRGVALDDDRIFRKTLPDEPDRLTVDLLLDASASQLDRQEIVAAQGYVIAESLTRCGLPVRISSFCSVDAFTILHLFRDYRETKKNANIFGYFAAGFNRDGLALRAALQTMRQKDNQNRLLIVLSDSRPNDMHKMRAEGRLPYFRDYSEEAAVRDTAKETRSLRESGVSLLCVFTGEDRDLPAAKQIYGKDLIRIRATERFADVVGSYIQKKIMDF